MAIASRPKSTVYHKQRSAGHHRHSKSYLKTYWPYLPMLMIVGVGLMINGLWSNVNVLGAKSDFSVSSLLGATNSDRAVDHEASLTIDPRLAAAAQAKAEDMINNNYWSHNSPDGKTPWTFITAAGYQYQSAGENLAYGFDNASDTVAGWMNSPEHRANILDGSYQNVGFGVASAPDYQGHGPATVVVAEYGQPAGAVVSAAALSSPGSPGDQGGTNVNTAAQSVSRVQLLTGGQAAWSALAVSALAGATLALLIVRHGLRLRRLVLEGESFVASHPMLDITITLVFTAGFVLSRTSGLIR